MATYRRHRKDFSGKSEYVGDWRENTLPMKPQDAATPSERARLIKLAGTEDVEAPLTYRSWNGWKEEPDSIIDFED